MYIHTYTYAVDIQTGRAASSPIGIAWSFDFFFPSVYTVCACACVCAMRLLLQAILMKFNENYFNVTHIMPTYEQAVAAVETSFRVKYLLMIFVEKWRYNNIFFRDATLLERETIKCGYLYSKTWFLDINPANFFACIFETQNFLKIIKKKSFTFWQLKIGTRSLQQFFLTWLISPFHWSKSKCSDKHMYTPRHIGRSGSLYVNHCITNEKFAQAVRLLFQPFGLPYGLYKLAHLSACPV